MSSVRFGRFDKLLCAKSEGFRGEIEIGGRGCRRFGVAVDLIFLLTFSLFFEFQMVKLLAVWSVDNRDSSKPHISHPSIYVFSIESLTLCFHHLRPPSMDLSSIEFFFIKIIGDNIKYLLYCVLE